MVLKYKGKYKHKYQMLKAAKFIYVVKNEKQT